MNPAIVVIIFVGVFAVRSEPINDNADCEPGHYTYDGRCLECHCTGGCECHSNTTGCTDCLHDRCADGWAGFPLCREELPMPSSQFIKWTSLHEDELTFTLLELPSLPSKTQGHLHIACHQNSEWYNVTLQLVEENADSITVAPGKPLDCASEFSFLDKSQENGVAVSYEYNFDAKPCTGWIIPADCKFNISQKYNVSTGNTDLNISWPAVKNDCDEHDFVSYHFLLSGDTEDYLMPTYLTHFSKSLPLLPGNPYNVTVTIFDVDDKLLKTCKQSFVARELVAPVMSRNNISTEQAPGTLNVTFSPWRAGIDIGTTPPVKYSVLYKLHNETYQSDWSAVDASVVGSNLKSSIPIRFPGQRYELKIRCYIQSRSGLVYNDSPDSKLVDTMLCQAPAAVDFEDDWLKFTSSRDVVEAYITYKESQPNCDGFVHYSAILQKYGEDKTREIDCGKMVSCLVSHMDAFSAYKMEIKATNQAGLHSTSGYKNFTTPEKAPHSPINIKSVVSDRRISITWDPPLIDRGPIDSYRIAIRHDGNIVAENETFLSRSFVFDGDYYRFYQITVRAHNSIDWGEESPPVTAEVPETVPGVMSSLFVDPSIESCVDFIWKAPHFLGGIVRSYMARCRLLLTYTNDSISSYVMSSELHMEPDRPLTYQMCGLIPGSHYNCSITAKNHKGEGPSLTNAVWLIPTKPHKLSLPRVIGEESTDTSITLFLPLADKRDGPASAFYIAVEVVDKKKRGVRSAESQPPEPGSDDLTPEHFPDYDENNRRYMAAKLAESDVGREFVIGSGATHNGYYNPPLRTSEFYWIYYGVEIKRAGVSRHTFVHLAEPVQVGVYEKNDDDNMVVAFASSITVISVVVIVIIFVYCMVLKRRVLLRRSATYRAELVPLSVRDGSNLSTEHDVKARVDFSSLTLPQLKSYIFSHQDDIDSQYEMLPSGFIAPITAAYLHSNKVKNRFANILPYDHTRVKLLEVPGIENSDYINASYIDGYYKTKQYIAASGPNEYTVNDFWRMVWEQRCTCIVMVTKCVEEGKVKCEKYWPDEKNVKKFGNIAVENIVTEHWAYFSMSTFRVEKDGSDMPLMVHKHHFTAWPDHGVPAHSTPFLQFHRKVKSTCTSLEGPIIVHCSAGVGRTGTFIAIDILLDQAKSEGKVHVFNQIQVLRNQRVSMVQTQRQYHYIYHALCEALSTEAFQYPASELHKIMHTDVFNNMLEEQFQSLSEACLSEPKDFQVGALKENISKNRNSNLLPHDAYRAVLMEQRGFGDYINAVTLNSYRVKDLFIATQIPLPSTVDDYLRLIYDHNVMTVVSLEPFSSLLDKGYGSYIPIETQAPLETELFTVIVNSVNDTRANIVVSEVTISYKVVPGKQPHTLKHFQANFWPVNEPLPETHDTFITLLELVDKWRQVTSSDMPICVQCRDGNARCGVFLAVWNALERLKSEQEVDVYHAVQLLRMVRPQLILGQLQYKYVYEVMSSYLQEFDLYTSSL